MPLNDGRLVEQWISYIHMFENLSFYTKIQDLLECVALGDVITRGVLVLRSTNQEQNMAVDFFNESCYHVLRYDVNRPI